MVSNYESRMKIYPYIIGVLFVVWITISVCDAYKQLNYINEKNYVMKQQSEHRDKQELQEEDNNQKIVSMILSLNHRVDKGVAYIIAKNVDECSVKYKLSRELIVSLMFRESGFNPLSVSSAKCLGLMQVNPVSHPLKIKPYKRYQLFHINVNVDIGCNILSQYLIKNKGNVKKALQNYLGANNTGYLIDVLSNYANLSMIQMRKD